MKGKHRGGLKGRQIKGEMIKKDKVRNIKQTWQWRNNNKSNMGRVVEKEKKEREIAGERIEVRNSGTEGNELESGGE